MFVGSFDRSFVIVIITSIVVIHSSDRPASQPATDSLTHSLIHVFIYLLIHQFIHSFIYLFTVCKDNLMDVVFAIDSSDNIKDPDYVRQAEFFEKLAGSFDISPDRTRVGSLLFSDQIQEMFNVVDYETIEGVKKGLSKLGMTAGSARVDLALRHILTKSFRYPALALFLFLNKHALAIVYCKINHGRSSGA